MAVDAVHGVRAEQLALAFAVRARRRPGAGFTRLLRIGKGLSEAGSGEAAQARAQRRGHNPLLLAAVTVSATLQVAAGLPQAVSLSVSVAVALLFATAVQMVLGELAPKNLAIVKPEALARVLSRSTLVYLAVAAPVIRLFDTVSNRLLRRVGIEPVEELPQGATAEDLDHIIASSREQGLLDEGTSKLLDRGLGFRSLTAAQAMVHRVDVVTVRGGEPASRVVDLLDTGHTRFPIVNDGVDDVIGVVAIGDVVDVEPADRDDVTVGSLATPAVLVPPTQPLPGVLERLRSEHQQLACVIDEFGGFGGVVSLEDIAEELVGEIRDEDDPPEPAAAPQPDGSWLLPGGWRLDQVADVAGVALPESMGTTP